MTAVYPNIPAEYVSFTNTSSSPDAFRLRGGQYGFTVTGTYGGGSVNVARQAPDGATMVTCLTTTQAGFATVNLPTGIYQIVITTATAVYCDLVSIVSGHPQ